MRPLSAEAYDGLKTASRRLAGAAGGVEAAASITRVGKTAIGRYQDPHGADFMPLDVVADLEAATGRPFVTEALARLARSLLLPLPVTPDADWTRGLAQLGAEIGDVFRRAQEALAGDGRIDAREAAALRDEVQGAMRALAGIEALLQASQQGAAATRRAPKRRKRPPG